MPGKMPNWLPLQRRFEQVKRRLPKLVANEAKNFFQDNFNRQGFLGSNGLERWKPRKAKTKNKGRAILVQSGALRRSLAAAATGNTARVYVSGPAKAYAAAHNNGFNGVVNVASHTRHRYGRIRPDGAKRSQKVALSQYTVKAHTRKVNLPQRRFIGNSSVLNRRLLFIIHKEIRTLKPN